MPRFARSVLTLELLLVAFTAGVALAQSDTTRSATTDSVTARSLGAVRILGRVDDLTGIASTASQGHIGSADLRLRPLKREGELLEAVPGLIVTQHSGDGKANQYFIRGFNLDHGTDFQTRLEGMPINSPTHAHGQGYTDLNFLIPELVDYIDYQLGVYHTELGDFGSAGGAEFHLKSKLDGPFATVETGENALARLALGTSKRVGRGDLLLGGELKSYSGPWALEEDIRKLSGLARYSWRRNASRFSVLGMVYHNKWNATDQVPERAVDDGTIDRFGYIDGTDGGNTQRYSLSGTWNHVSANASQLVQVFGAYSDLSLFSNFTYFLDNPVQGDQFNAPRSALRVVPAHRGQQSPSDSDYPGQCRRRVPTGRVRVQASVLNLFNARASDIQYYYASRLPGEATSGATDIHFHPVERRQLRISLGWGAP